MSTKADYVRSQGQTRNHHCHWPGCDKQVPPAMWGCKGHWYRKWESSCGGWEDLNYHCAACGKKWWVEGIDS